MKGFEGWDDQHPTQENSVNKKGASDRPDNIGYHGEDTLAAPGEYSNVTTTDYNGGVDSRNHARKSGQLPDPTLINRGYVDNDQGNFTSRNPGANRQRLGARNSINKGQ